ncbi:hypothetical protein JQ607_31915 [Bradyrhizobium liaoningense]|uniref:hypothetical protein n=1 Tax=Bradyrhizobium liaoningense TaxID=43992 RepID=UPI001BAABACF|nr:hypothetical protein [Bradyrhizobium liaoningense]MBR0844829.1 hypothetical protein [Bradyrhizobium liaoningense]MBR0854998.1 hypothetical protein [Bradyrhizobium liaoningense]
MPTTIPLRFNRPQSTRRGFVHVVPSDLFGLVAYSLTGVMIDGLAALGAHDGQGSSSAGLLLIVVAPALAAAAALCVAGLPGRPADRRR